MSFTELQDKSPFVSIIIPTFNEQHHIEKTLHAVCNLRGNFEVIVVDGASDDNTLAVIARCRCDAVRVINSERGRGKQMHAGASSARGEILWFVHADIVMPVDAVERIVRACEDESVVGGNFKINFDGDSRAARFLSWLYPRLRSIGLCYGDSAIFVRADVYGEVGGFKPLPLFEDLELVRAIRRRGRMRLVPAFVTTSSRRFEHRSFLLTFARWSLLQTLYWMGVSPHTLSRRYAVVRGDANVKSEAELERDKKVNRDAKAIRDAKANRM